MRRLVDGLSCSVSCFQSFLIRSSVVAGLCWRGSPSNHDHAKPRQEGGGGEESRLLLSMTYSRLNLGRSGACCSTSTVLRTGVTTERTERTQLTRTDLWSCQLRLANSLRVRKLSGKYSYSTFHQNTLGTEGRILSGQVFLSTGFLLRASRFCCKILVPLN